MDGASYANALAGLVQGVLILGVIILIVAILAAGFIGGCIGKNIAKREIRPAIPVVTTNMVIQTNWVEITK